MDEKIKQVVKAVRLLKGIKQMNIATALNVEDSYYSKIENGAGTLNMARLYTIAECLGLEARDLLELGDLVMLPGFEHEPADKIISLHVLKLQEHSQSSAFTIDELRNIISRIRSFGPKKPIVSK